MPAFTVIAIKDRSGIALDAELVDVIASRETAQLGRVDANLDDLLAVALARYPLRISDNIDPGKLADLHQKARVVAEALMERGDARAYALARRMLTLAVSAKSD